MSQLKPLDLLSMEWKMILEEDFIEQAVSGQLELPVLSDYHFYFDVEKALIKARATLGLRSY